MHRLAGPVLSQEALSRALEVLRGSTVAEIAARFELDPERVRLLPAGILVLTCLSERLGLPLEIARGGLREGVLLELLEGPEAAA
jgi:exopolyphosphatase/guanosine-5'-triphosphate,3'-diphosphate pyrophosphatase